MARDTLERLIRDVPDFPKPGILFKDITPVLEDAAALRAVIDAMAEQWRDRGVTHVVGVESRGFIFGTGVAYAMDVGLVLVRKPGKLPRETSTVSYQLEYGSDSLEMHVDALGPEDRVVIIDDVLATGGTAGAVARMVVASGARVEGIAFVLELSGLSGRAALPEGLAVHSLLTV